jgi:hypothetical protein
MSRLSAAIRLAVTSMTGLATGLWLSLIGPPSTAQPSIAQPDDLLPYCSGNETPANNNCRAGNDQVFEDSAPGANPGVPVGVDPGHSAAT